MKRFVLALVAAVALLLGLAVPVGLMAATAQALPASAGPLSHVS
ncbi:MAG: hypothetical protein ACLQDY_15320 [Streptosporangiaceae bacterium]